MNPSGVGRAVVDSWFSDAPMPEAYTHPALWDFFTPNRDNHGSFFFDWGSEEEAAWKDNYRRWMAFVNDYKNRGGRVTVGSDSGYIYKTYGFGTIEELELLREAGFHPLEVIRAATLAGAQALGAADRIGSIEPGKYADLVVLSELCYYLHPEVLRDTLDREIPLLKSGTTVISAHWRHPVAEYPMTGAYATDVIAATTGLHHLGGYRDADVIIEVFDTKSSMSVAARTGVPGA